MSSLSSLSLVPRWKVDQGCFRLRLGYRFTPTQKRNPVYIYSRRNHFFHETKTVKQLGIPNGELGFFFLCRVCKAIMTGLPVPYGAGEFGMSSQIGCKVFAPLQDISCRTIKGSQHPRVFHNHVGYSGASGMCELPLYFKHGANPFTSGSPNYAARTSVSCGGDLRSANIATNFVKRGDCGRVRGECGWSALTI